MKTNPKTSGEILDQVVKARQVLDYFDAEALDERGELRDGATARSRLNAAKAHIMRAMEKAQTLK